MTALTGEDYILEFQGYFQEQILSVIKLEHKGNNQLFRIILPDAQYMLKKYSMLHRDNWERGKSEFRAITHMWSEGFREIPMPIYFDEKRNIAVYSYEEGKVLDSREVKRKDISVAVNFLVKLNRLGKKDKEMFSPASAACLSLIEYQKIIDRRLDIIIDYEPDSFIGQDARSFLDNKICPKIKELKSIFSEKTTRLDTESDIPLEEQVLSPADFGFHNILVNGENYKFIDFEYFGRDDPVRQTLDFIHHAQSEKISNKLKEYFLASYRAKRNLSKDFEARLKLVDPLVGMAWVLIYLNPLSRDYMKHIQFAHGNVDNLLEDRLNKAKRKFQEIYFFTS